MISNSLNLNRDVLSMINTNKQAVRKVVGNQQVNRKVRPMFIAAVSASKEITQFSVFYVLKMKMRCIFKLNLT